MNFKSQLALWKQSELIISALILLIGSSLLLCSVLFYLSRKTPAIPAARLVAIHPKTIIRSTLGFIGNQSAGFTLVEFGDYECPPCRRANHDLQTVLSASENQIRFQFRNFPLSAIHRLARPAAIAAEASRTRGDFWTVHEALYANPLSKSRIQDVIQAYHLEAAMNDRSALLKANEAIDEDLEVGQSIGVQSTPTFFLCCPDNRVYKLGSVEQVIRFLPATVHAHIKSLLG